MTISAPVTIPAAIAYRTAVGRSTPLTNVEIDQNFAFLHDFADNKLSQSDFTSTAIITKLNADLATSNPGGLNVSLLRGAAPSTSATVNTVVLRNGFGDFSARQITAEQFIGNAATATLADEAVKLETPVLINGVSFDGSSNITIADSTKLAKAGDAMTGKLTLAASTTSAASLYFQQGVEPTSPSNGDVWLTSSGMFGRVGGITRQFAYTTSDISGLSSNVSGIVAVNNGGTGAWNAEQARVNLEVAKSGVNNDITRLSALSTPITSSQGGTGLASPGAAGNVLVSDGSAWTSMPIHYPVSGMIAHFAGLNVPTGWLPCDGRSLLRSDFPALFNAIGLTYTGIQQTLYGFNAGQFGYPVVTGYGTEKTPSGTGLGETGGFNTLSVGAGSYLRFGNYSEEEHGLILSITASACSSYTATLTFPAKATAPYAVGTRILVAGANNAGYNGIWEVTAATTSTVSFKVATPNLPSGSGGTIQRLRFATFSANARFSNIVSFTAMRGNGTNGGERPNDASDSLKLYYKNQSTGFLTLIGTIYPSTGDPYATTEEASDSYASSWRTRTLIIPVEAQKDNQQFEIIQASVGAEFGSYTIYKGLADTFGVRDISFVQVTGTASDNLTFQLPDLRGEFIRGWDAGRGIDSGRQLGTMQRDALGPHRHTLTSNAGTQFYATNTTAGAAESGVLSGGGTTSSGIGQRYPFTGYVDGAGGSIETRPRNVALIPCIKI